MKIRTLSRYSCLALVSTLAGPLAAQMTTRVSVGTGGTQGDLESYSPAITADGRYIAFYSDASTLVAGDLNGVGDIFLRDRLNRTTILVSLGAGAVQADGDSNYPALSDDSRIVAFESQATNLAGADANGVSDVYLRDRQSGLTTRVSLGLGGQEPDGPCFGADLSADGRYVLFTSYASNLVAGDANGRADAFLHDRSSGTTTRVSTDSAGAEANRGINFAYLSDDASHVVFDSPSTNLVPGDTNGAVDVFERDLLTGVTTRVNVATGGAQANFGAAYPTISADGRFVVFGSLATNLVAGDTNGDMDVFVHDLVSGTTVRVDLDPSGAQVHGYSSRGTISADGRYVAFKSDSAELVPGDTNGTLDIFVRDLVTGRNQLVSVSSTGVPGNAHSSQPILSADGRHVTFYSEASTLVPGDTNGEWDVFVRSFGKIRAR